MLAKPSKYGIGLGPSQPIAKVPVHFDLTKGGLNFTKAPTHIEEGETPNCLDVRVSQGGVSPDFDVTALSTAYAGAGDKTILHIAPYQLESGTKFLMRLRPAGWDRWNGINWFTLSGALTGLVTDRLYSLTMQDKFVVANGADKLKRWDGVDGNAIVDLSADAPIARYMTRIGNRILAAYIKTGGVWDPHKLQWCADGLITDWTTAGLGAGSVVKLPEGSDKSANWITGLATILRGALIFRQQSIELASLTGTGAAPFRFQTIKFAPGTQSPYSLAGDSDLGVFFLGSDLLVYLITNEGELLRIGLPVFPAMKNSIGDPAHCLGTIDTKTMEYLLAVPSVAAGPMVTAWAFSIYEWVTNQRLAWRKRNVPLNTFAMSFGPVPTSGDPIVDTVTDIVDTVNRTPDSFAVSNADERVLFGNNVGQVSYMDTNIPLSTGSWESKQLGDGVNEFTIDEVEIEYDAKTAATVEVSVSMNGNESFFTPIQHILTPGSKVKTSKGEHGLTGKLGQLRLRFLTGDCRVSKINAYLDNRGRA